MGDSITITAVKGTHRGTYVFNPPQKLDYISGTVTSNLVSDKSVTLNTIRINSEHSNSDGKELPNSFSDKDNLYYKITYDNILNYKNGTSGECVVDCIVSGWIYGK